jgi:hypothetical protein
MDNIFKNNNESTIYDLEPYVLIDKSDSTHTKYYNNNDSLKVIDKELDIAYEILSTNNITKCNIITWSSDVDKNEKINLEDLKNNRHHYNIPNGYTYLTPPLNKVLENIIENNESNKDIYIFTDGEIMDCENIRAPLYDLFNKNINIYIITVECNNKDYYSADCNVGTKLYNYLKYNSKMNYIKKIIHYNNTHDEEGFISLENFNVPDGYLPFKNSLFLISDIPKFKNCLKDKINECGSDNEILKLTFDLSRTIFYLTKDKETMFRKMIVDHFTNYFINTNIYSDVKQILMNEINNHINHKSSTFQDYKTNRNKLFEKSQLNLLADTKDAITNNSTDIYVSFPIVTTNGTKIFNVNERFMNCDINIGKNKFKNSGFNFNKYNIPLFPSNITENNNTDQCLRQWVRSNYSSIYNIEITSGKILCLLLIDFLKIHLSDVSNNLKDDYLKLSNVMLNAKTYNSNKEITKILLDKHELPCYYYFGNYLNNNDIKLTKGCLWLAILISLNNDNLIESQKHIYINDVVEFMEHKMDENYQINKGEFIDKFNMIFFEKIDKIHEIFIKQKYVIPEHECMISIKCNNDYICEDDYNSSEKHIKCYRCNNLIPKDDIIINDINNAEIVFDNTYNIYSQNSCENIKLDLTDDKTLYKINDLNFNISSYNIQNVQISDVLNKTQMRIKTKEKFNEKARQKYPYLVNLDMKNVCLAGGFVRSILLNQQMKDFDFFIYGVDNPVERLEKLMHDLITNIKNTEKDGSKTKFLYLYKSLYNVFEIIYIEDPTNHFDENFIVDNFAQYNYKSLKNFDEKNIIKNDKCYFEDNDNKGIRIKQRFQFIMCKYNSIEDIIDSFDLSPSCVGYDGDEIYFTQNSYLSYKYMSNIISNNKYTECYDSRISKYFSYGFDIVFPEKDIKDINEFKEKFKNTNDSVQLCSLKFDIVQIDNNKIIINHDSHKKELLAYIDELERKSQEKNETGLYKSSFFCNLTSILRYVCINKIKYEFNTNILEPFAPHTYKFKNGEHQLSFVDKINVKVGENKWYVDNCTIPPKKKCNYISVNNRQNNILNNVENNNNPDNNDI